MEMKPMRRIQLDCIDYQTEHRHLMTRLALLHPEDPERQAWDFDEASYQEFLKSHDKEEKETNGYSIVPRYIVTIGDHFSKLRRYFPVHSKRPAVIARCLADWVSMHGPFDVLHADNGTDVMNVAGFDPNLYSRETTNDEKYKQYRISFTDLQRKSIIDHVRWMIPGILCVHGLPHHSESQGFVENCNKFARKYLRCATSTICFRPYDHTFRPSDLTFDLTTMLFDLATMLFDLTTILFDLPTMLSTLRPYFSTLRPGSTCRTSALCIGGREWRTSTIAPSRQTTGRPGCLHTR